MSSTKLADKAFAMLFVGQRVGAEISPSSEDLRAWIVVCPYVNDGRPGGASYRGVEPASFHVWRFEAPIEYLEAGYDIAGDLRNEKHADVPPHATAEETIRAVSEVVASWSIDPALLGPLDDDFPL